MRETKSRESEMGGHLRQSDELMPSCLFQLSLIIRSARLFMCVCWCRGDDGEQGGKKAFHCCSQFNMTVSVRAAATGLSFAGKTEAGDVKK